MGENSAISWTDHTFNPWWGCVKISPACTNCYAATFDKRVGGNHWGPTSERRFFGDKHWNEPRKWNRLAEKAGVRARVFCASMADVFEDRRDLDEHRERLWKLIAETPHLDWLLLTKRPENIARMLPPVRTRNIWLGTTVENQEYAIERIPHLLANEAAVHFLSCEPLLGPVDLRGVERGNTWSGGDWIRSFRFEKQHDDGRVDVLEERKERIDWVIAGCESGPGARECRIEWLQSLRDQCAAAGVPYFLKQAVEDSGMGPDDLCDQCGERERWFVYGPRDTSIRCGCTVECPEDADWHPLVGAGEGSKRKAGGVIELPYLDGVQHAAFPKVCHDQ